MPLWPACPKSVEQDGSGRWQWVCLLGTLLLMVGMECGMVWQAGWAACHTIADLAPQGAFGIADNSGRLLEDCNPDRSLLPASVLKIATVSAGLAILGPDFRFHTEWYLDSQNNLYVKGYGDPHLVSEDLAQLARQLRQQGLGQVQHLFIDTSAFALTNQAPGRENSDNPYDAPVGPMAVNFNTVAITKDKSGRVVSAEPQTPTLPIMQELGQGRPPGPARINVLSRGGDADQLMSRYAGELLQALFRENDIAVASVGGIRQVPLSAHLLLTSVSRGTLSDMSRQTLAYSSNFMANLLFLACGAKQYGYPATWEKARAAVQQALSRQLGPATAATFIQVDGAGLSRENRVTVQGMLSLLAHFRQHRDLLRQERGVWIKSGTMTGVYNLAGYLPDGQAFVILLNQANNNRAAVLERLQARVSTAQGNRPAVAAPTMTGK